MPFDKLKFFRSDNKPKLLYVINHIDWFWSHRYSLAKSAQEHGWEVYVACHGSEKDTALVKEGFKPVEIPEYEGGIKPRSLLKVIKALRQEIKGIEPDVVHAITIKYAFMTSFATLFLKGPRVIFTIAGLGYLFSDNNLKADIIRFIGKPALKLAFARKDIFLIFQNTDDLKIMTQNGFVKKENTKVILGSGVNIHKFVHSPEPQDKTPVVFMPTRLVKDKGVAIFVEAAKIVQEQGHKANFIIGGGLDTNNPSALTEQEMHEILEGSNVTWRGKIIDMPRMYRRSNIVVYPSYYREGVPKVLLEAASAGRAIITTDHPGCREVVDHNVNGLLVPVKDEQKTAEAIIDLLENKDKRIKMARKSREKAANEFNVGIINAETMAVYENIIDLGSTRVDT